jgi:hypothetical protein
MGVSRPLGRWLAGFLTAPASTPSASMPTDMGVLARAVRPADVLLVEGQHRISTAIKYLTQSTWSHAAICVSQGDEAAGLLPQFVEADVKDGVRQVSLSEFAGLHSRLCRPVGLTAAEVDAVVKFVTDRIGDEYDLANVIDLARYLLPTPPVPTAWRRRMIAFGSGEPTKAICSTLIAQAFQSIRYPILPHLELYRGDDPDCADCAREILHIRHHSLFTPRDFDVSPYFRVVKPMLEAQFDYRKLEWSEDSSQQQRPLDIAAG